jgi:peroxiredoxin Q/BCP
MHRSSGLRPSGSSNPTIGKIVGSGGLMALALVLIQCRSAVPAGDPGAGVAAETASQSPPPAAVASAAAIEASVPAASASTATETQAPPDDLVGKPAPDFTGKAQDGTSVHLASLKGKRVVLYFYPKDETPGCTKEACSFRDAWVDLAKTGAVLIGVSADSAQSHKDFVAHWKLPFLLLSDPDGKIGATYGVPFAGHHQRQTFVIGPDGNVQKVYRKVDVTVHASQVLEDVSKT